MKARPANRRNWPGGLVGTYALFMMRRAPIYGGELAQRIGDLTRDAWRPSAGAIYPILRGLVQRGDARVGRREGRKVYILTPRGAARLKLVRERIRERGGRFAELRSLVLDMVEPEQRGEILLDHLHRAIQPFVELRMSTTMLPKGAARSRVLARARAELEGGLVGLRAARRSARG
jgi:DNA-binding PadR family transcriptional regulator